jgi:hypothetical protein
MQDIYAKVSCAWLSDRTAWLGRDVASRGAGELWSYVTSR